MRGGTLSQQTRTRPRSLQRRTDGASRILEAGRLGDVDRETCAPLCRHGDRRDPWMLSSLSVAPQGCFRMAPRTCGALPGGIRVAPHPSSNGCRSNVCRLRWSLCRGRYRMGLESRRHQARSLGSHRCRILPRRNVHHLLRPARLIRNVEAPAIGAAWGRSTCVLRPHRLSNLRDRGEVQRRHRLRADGGLVTATLLTLFVLPAVYSVAGGAVAAPEEAT